MTIYRLDVLSSQLENNYTKEVLALMRKFYSPQHIFPLGGPAKGIRTSREFDFEGQWDLITELPKDRGNRFLEGSNKIFLCTKTQEKGAVTPQKNEPDMAVGVQESPVEAWM